MLKNIPLLIVLLCLSACQTIESPKREQGVCKNTWPYVPVKSVADNRKAKENIGTLIILVKKINDDGISCYAIAYLDYPEIKEPHNTKLKKGDIEFTRCSGRSGPNEAIEEYGKLLNTIALLVQKKEPKVLYIIQNAGGEGEFPDVFPNSILLKDYTPEDMWMLYPESLNPWASLQYETGDYEETLALLIKFYKKLKCSVSQRIIYRFQKDMEEPLLGLILVGENVFTLNCRNPLKAMLEEVKAMEKEMKSKNE